jgi:hypothetical protein
VNKKASNPTKFTQMQQNVYTGKNFLSNAAKYRVFCIKMVRIFQQCSNRYEKQDLLTALGLWNLNNRKFDMKMD